MTTPLPEFPNRDELKIKLDGAFAALKELVEFGDKAAQLAGRLDAVEAMLAENKGDSLLKASKELRDVEIEIEKIRLEKNKAAHAATSRDARLTEANTAVDMAVTAISKLNGYAIPVPAKIANLAKPEFLGQDNNIALALQDELKHLVKQYEVNGIGHSEFKLHLKSLEERALIARTQLDEARSGGKPVVVGIVIVVLSILIMAAIAIWGKPGVKDALLERVPWSVLASASVGVLFMIIGVMSEKINDFDTTRIPDYFHRFAQAWAYTILLTLVLPVSYTVEVADNVPELPLDDILIAFFVGMFVYQVEKALKELGIRLLPIEKFLERKQLLPSASWVDAMKTERQTLFTEFQTAVGNKSIAGEKVEALKARFKDVDEKIAANNEAVARSALDGLSIEIKLAAASTADGGDQ